MAMNATEFVRFVIENLVERPEDVRIKEIEGDSATVLEIEVAKEDTPHVIGRQGRVINALRDVVRALSRRQKKKIVIEVL